MKHRKRDQKAKFSPIENTALYEAMQEIRRSSAAQPHRNKAKYDRNDARREQQRGDW